MGTGGEIEYTCAMTHTFHGKIGSPGTIKLNNQEEIVFERNY